MRAFTTLRAKMAPLPNANIDTDQIIPAQYLKSLDRDGLARGLFEAQRFDAENRPKADFVLNQPQYQGVGVIVVGDNFGCGSSREHAVWALLEFGIRCVISTSFGDIFYANCVQNGLLPVTLDAGQVQELMAQAFGDDHEVDVDLRNQTVTTPSGQVFHFPIDHKRKDKLLRGLDAIGETLDEADKIDLFEQRQILELPWLDPAVVRSRHHS